MTRHPDEPTSTEASVLVELLARVEAAEGADREIDGEAFVALEWTKENTDPETWETLQHEGWRAALKYMHYGWRGGTWVPRYTASLDVAMALCDRVLPGWAPAIRKDPRPAFGGLWHAFVARNDSGRDQHAEWGSTPALALVSALLKAKIAQAASPADRAG